MKLISMRTNFYRPSVYTIAMILLMQTASAQVQAPVVNERYVNRQHIIDSLQLLVSQLHTSFDSLNAVAADQQTANAQLQKENLSLAAENKKLQDEFHDALGEKLQSSHTSSVLFIMNVLVGIFLLLALLWMFMRKKGSPAEDNTDEIPKPQPQAKLNGYALPLEHQLDQIEKLGSLREKGLLTDDEFNLQKRQILGEKH